MDFEELMPATLLRVVALADRQVYVSGYRVILRSLEIWDRFTVVNFTVPVAEQAREEGKEPFRFVHAVVDDTSRTIAEIEAAVGSSSSSDAWWSSLVLEGSIAGSKHATLLFSDGTDLVIELA